MLRGKSLKCMEESFSTYLVCHFFLGFDDICNASHIFFHYFSLQLKEDIARTEDSYGKPLLWFLDKRPY